MGKGKMFKVTDDVTLTREQKLMIRAWRNQWPCATDEERDRMTAEFDRMVREAKEGKEEKPWQLRDDGARTAPKEEAAAVTAAVQEAEEKSQRTEDPLSDRPHALYCGGAELIPIVKGEKDVWADYPTFLAKNPGKTIFDVHPSRVAVAFINQKLYNALLETEKALDQNEVNRCIQRLPKEFTPFELNFLEALLCMEADYDPRIKKLGYTGSDMKGYKDCGLFKDYFTGKIFETLRNKAKNQAKSEKSEKSGKNNTGGNQKGVQNNKGKSGSGSSQGKTSVKSGDKPNGSKGNIRPGSYDQSVASFLL